MDDPLSGWDCHAPCKRDKVPPGSIPQRRPDSASELTLSTLRALTERLWELVAEEHEQCPDGSHWNDNKGKCMKIGAHTSLGRALSQAASASARASSSMTHSQAAGDHASVAYRARKRGFHELAKHHTGEWEHHKAAARALIRGEADAYFKKHGSMP